MDNIRAWYTSNYPDDIQMGAEINENAEFSGVQDNLNNFYEYIGVYDSIIRERVFTELSERLNVSYDLIYDKWLVMA